MPLDLVIRFFRASGLLLLLVWPLCGVAQVSEAETARTPSDSVSWYRSRNPRQALNYGFRFIHDAQGQAVTLELAEVYTEMGHVYLDQGLYRLSTEAYSRALAIWRQLHLWERAGGSYHDLGYVYETQKQPELALTHYRHGAALRRSVGVRDYVGFGLTLTNIGSIYKDQHQYAKADSTFREALALFQRAKHIASEAQAYRYLGVNALARQQWEESLRYLQLALTNYVQAADYNQVGLCYLALAQRADSMRIYPEAIQHCQAALAQFRRMKNHEYMAVALLEEGRTRRLMGQPAQAVPLVIQVLDTAQRYNLQPLRLKALHELAAAAHAAGEPTRALAYYQQTVAQQENLTGNQAISATLEEELEQQWITAKTEAERFAADREQQRLRFIWLVALAVALGGVVVLLLLFLRQRNRSLEQTRQLAQQEKQLLTQQEELSRLQAEQLTHELQQRHHELGTMALDLVRSNELLGEILGEVNQLKPYLNGEGQRQVQQLILRRHLLAQDEHWRTFDREFQRLHTNFYERLEQRFPSLTANERQLCALLRMQLNNNEITAITLRSLNSVYVAKSRLRKKIGVELDEEMQEVLEAL